MSSWANKGRAVTEGRGLGSAVAQVTLLLDSHPSTTTAAPDPSPLASSISPSPTNLDGHTGETRVVSLTRTFLGPLLPMPWEPSRHPRPHPSGNLLCGCLTEEGHLSYFQKPVSAACRSVGQILGPGGQVGPRPRIPPG